MKIAQPWKCDICGRQKGATNHWWIGYPHSFPARGACVQIWDEALAAIEQTGLVHLCGLQCVNRWINLFLPSLVEESKGE